MKKFIKKYWFIILIVILSIIRFLMSYRLPSYIIQNLKYDDHLVFTQTNNLFKGNYLGIYSKYTLVKGIIFPLILTLIKYLKLTYSIGLTIIYILCTLYFTLSCKKITNNKIILLIIYVALLFNPLTYSAELFQRFSTCRTWQYQERAEDQGQEPQGSTAGGLKLFKGRYNLSYWHTVQTAIPSDRYYHGGWVVHS